jgi:hypothetical protein
MGAAAVALVLSEAVASRCNYAQGGQLNSCEPDSLHWETRTGCAYKLFSRGSSSRSFSLLLLLIL